MHLTFANMFWICSNLFQLPCYSFKELEENLRDAQCASQRLETQLVQKEILYEDKIKVCYRYLFDSVHFSCQFCHYNHCCVVMPDCHIL